MLEAAGPGSKWSKPSSNLTGTNPVKDSPGGRIPWTTRLLRVWWSRRRVLGDFSAGSADLGSLLSWSRRDPTKATALGVARWGFADEIFVINA